MVKHECAVKGCTETGFPQQCLGDGSSHHHGAMHYDCQRVAMSGHGLEFRDDGEWYWMCNIHYRHIKEMMRAKGLLLESLA